MTLCLGRTQLATLSPPRLVRTCVVEGKRYLKVDASLASPLGHKLHLPE